MDKTTCGWVCGLLTDMYQLTMAYGYFSAGRHEEPAVFDLFFRKCPFNMSYAVIAGIQGVREFVNDYHFNPEHIAYLRTVLPASDEFYRWLETLDTSAVTLRCVSEGSVCFPRVPIIRVSGPLGICQLLETTLLNQINFATLAATNAARFRTVAGRDVRLVEFGLRRAQGPDGGMTASRSAYIGGFDGTSNVLAAGVFGIPVRGTQAHAFVTSFDSLEQIKQRTIKHSDTGNDMNLVDLTLVAMRDLGYSRTHEGELASFISYAITFPTAFLALVDTYNTLESGVKNAIAVSLALSRCGYSSLGIRLDSGDLAALSIGARQLMREAAKLSGVVGLASLGIVASDDITVPRIEEMNKQGHEITTFGIGTHMVTCKAQPALGAVYKLVSISGRPVIKLSATPAKVTLPGAKATYRVLDQAGKIVLDIITLEDEPAPVTGGSLRVYNTSQLTDPNTAQSSEVTPIAVSRLDEPLGDSLAPSVAVSAAKTLCEASLATLSTELREAEDSAVVITERLFALLVELMEKAQNLG